MGASGASVLVSELPDTLSLAYLRLRSQSDPGAQVQIFADKRKIRNARMDIPYFWRREPNANNDKEKYQFWVTVPVALAA